MAVELGILDVGRSPAHVNGEQAYPPCRHGRIRNLVLGNDDDGGGSDGDPGILVRRRLHAARDHETDVHVVGHPVRPQRPVERFGQRRTVEPDVEIEGLRAFIEPVEMDIEKRDAAAMHPQSFPHSVPEHESAVEDRYPGFVTRHVLAVDVDENLLVARIGTVLVCPFAHGVDSSVTAPLGPWLADRVAASASPKRANAANMSRVHSGMERARNVHCTSAHSPDPLRTIPITSVSGKAPEHVLQTRAALRCFARGQALQPHVAAGHRRARDGGDRDRHPVHAAPQRARIVNRPREHQHAEHDDGAALEHAQRTGFESFDVLEPERRRHQRDASHEPAG